MRSFKSLREFNQKWKEEAEGNLKKLKFFKNVEFESLIQGEDDLDLYHVTQPGLHLLYLGAANCVWKAGGAVP